MLAPAPDPAASAEAVGAAGVEPGPALGRRLASRRTLLSLLLTAAVLAAAVWRSGIDWKSTWSEIRGADLRLYALAVVAYYTSFLLRSLRWQLLLRNTGVEVPLPPLFETLLASFFVNCVVPAKMGDVYRAIQLRARQRVSGGRSLGTIIAERLLDLFVLMGLLVIAGAVTFRDRVPRTLVPYFLAGLALCVVATAALGVMTSGRGQRLLRYLPEAAVRRYESFRTGTVDAFGRWGEVVPLSIGVWVLEGTRLGLVVLALGQGQQVGPAHFLLIALVAALLTTVPFLPGGLVLVEGGMVAVLTTITTVSKSTAVGIALLDRSISYGTLILIGGIVFLVFHARGARRTTLGLAAEAES
jgi:uncharacterized protein (TIRG00374 family)